MHTRGTTPKPFVAPALDDFFQSEVPGLYLIGEAAGKPLVKNAANLGRAVVEHIVAGGLDRRTYDVVIVGSGPGGLAAALACESHSLRYVVLEKERIVASTVARYPKGKLVMAEPSDCKNVSHLPVFDGTKEDLLSEWFALAKGLPIRLGEMVDSVIPSDGGFRVCTSEGEYEAHRVILAPGTRGAPRRLGVPGEAHPKVKTMLDDPAAHRGQDVLVVGGGDSAVEAAAALAEVGARVALSYRGPSMQRAQPRNRKRLDALVRAGALELLLGSRVSEVTPDDVTMSSSGGTSRRANQACFVLIGAEPPLTWLERQGIRAVARPHDTKMSPTDELVARSLSIGARGSAPVS